MAGKLATKNIDTREKINISNSEVNTNLKQTKEAESTRMSRDFIQDFGGHIKLHADDATGIAIRPLVPGFHYAAA